MIRARVLGMVIILITLLVLVAGLAIYIMSQKPKTMEIGRITFFVGLFWLVWQLSNEHMLHLFDRVK
jgi:Na+/phosphate symporter